MLLITKSIALLLLPPASLILLAVVGLLFLKYRGGKELVIIALALLWILSTEPMRDALVSPLETHYTALKINHKNMKMLENDNIAIVLLGGGIYEKAPEFNDRNALSDHALMRTIYAAELAKRTKFDVYATGGPGLSDNKESEGKVMQRWLIKLGVRPSKVFSEASAKNTWENATHIRDILQKKEIKRIILVTTAWHMPRAVHVFKSQGLQVIPAPCAYVATKGAYNMLSFLPQADVLADSSDALHEYIGILWYQWAYAE